MTEKTEPPIEITPCPYVNGAAADNNDVSFMLKNYEQYSDFVLFEDGKPTRCFRFPGGVRPTPDTSLSEKIRGRIAEPANEYEKGHNHGLEDALRVIADHRTPDLEAIVNTLQSLADNHVDANGNFISERDEGMFDAFERAIAIVRDHCEHPLNMVGYSETSLQVDKHDMFEQSNGNIFEDVRIVTQLLETIKDFDWHGKWRIHKAIERLKAIGHPSDSQVDIFNAEHELNISGSNTNPGGASSGEEGVADAPKPQGGERSETAITSSTPDAMGTRDDNTRFADRPNAAPGCPWHNTEQCLCPSGYPVRCPPEACSQTGQQRKQHNNVNIQLAEHSSIQTFTVMPNGSYPG